MESKVEEKTGELIMIDRSGKEPIEVLTMVCKGEPVEPGQVRHRFDSPFLLVLNSNSGVVLAGTVAI